ncbi:MAG: sugar transferase [bacterium]
MSKRNEIPALVVTDFVTICTSWVSFYFIRVRSGLLDLSIEPELLIPMFIICAFWLLLFWALGLYRSWYAASRVDEITRLFKASIFGCLFLFFAIFVDDQGKNVAVSSRLLIAIYWGILFSFVTFGRLSVRSIQRGMLIRGIGVHKTLIVGSPVKATELYHEVKKYPALGYGVIGFATVDTNAQAVNGLPLLGNTNELQSIIPEYNVQDVLIALDSSDHSHLLKIISNCSAHNVGLKIIPDLYDIISGQARTNQIYGFPLIEISPQIISPWEEFLKRTFDIGFSATVIVLGLPIWLVVTLIIRLESQGAALYKQERVGKDGKVFNIFKFRSMREDAEIAGPQWANKRDVRVTRVGKWLRKLHIDEIPQMWNILKGEMSLVGPRPERPIFVEQLSKEIPLYPRRLKVRPGLTGWAQVKHKYDESVDDVRKKVQYDLFYIENMSLRMDIKIILSTISHTLLGRGHT